MKYVILFLMPFLFVSCKSPVVESKPEAEKKKEKWLTYNDRIMASEKALRKEQGVRTATTYGPGLALSISREVMLSRATYDQDGNLIEEITYAEGKEVIKHTNNRFENDLLMESVVRNKKGRDYTARYQYDREGNRLHEVLYRPTGDTLLARSYAYDKSGNETKAVMVNPKRKMRLQKITSYDTLGRPLKITERKGNAINWIESYSYQGNSWTTERKNGKGQVLGIFKSRFNDQRQALSIENQDGEGKTRLAIQYKYDAKGRLQIEDYRGKDGASQQRYEYRYNREGLLIEKKTVNQRNPAGSVTRVEYTYH